MTHRRPVGASVGPLDAATAALVRLSACITAGGEEDVRRALADCASAGVRERWIEELVLQSYLFAGFPRALNAAREWRRTGDGSGEKRRSGSESLSAAPAIDGAAEGYADLYEWRTRGEETCATVYGVNYEKLRTNIRALHPSLDEWMIVEGYGKVLSRPGLDLARRELCVVAACAAAGQDRQLQSHLHGALNAGAGPDEVSAALEALEGVVGERELERARLLWERINKGTR
jgi:4-carboxymuconolactone decarboxylase